MFKCKENAKYLQIGFKSLVLHNCIIISKVMLNVAFIIYAPPYYVEQNYGKFYETKTFTSPMIISFKCK